MKKIILAEDEELLSQIYKDTLERDGYEVLLAHDGKTAMKLLDPGGADLMIIDVRLPDIGGIELLEKAKERCPEMPVVMCSAYDTYNIDMKKLETKIADFIVKPVSLEELKMKIRKILK